MKWSHKESILANMRVRYNSLEHEDVQEINTDGTSYKVFIAQKDLYLVVAVDYGNNYIRATRFKII